MYHIGKLFIEDSGNWRGNFRTAIGALGTIGTLFYSLKIIEKSNNLLRDRLINENYKFESIRDIKFLKTYQKENGSIIIEKGNTLTIFIEKLEENKRIRFVDLNINNIENGDNMIVESKIFKTKGRVIIDLAQYTNFNEIYGIYND